MERFSVSEKTDYCELLSFQYWFSLTGISKRKKISSRTIITEVEWCSADRADSGTLIKRDKFRNNKIFKWSQA